jgi:hypothetical protein
VHLFFVWNLFNEEDTEFWGSIAAPFTFEEKVLKLKNKVVLKPKHKGMMA